MAEANLGSKASATMGERVRGGEAGAHKSHQHSQQTAQGQDEPPVGAHQGEEQQHGQNQAVSNQISHRVFLRIY